MKIAVLDQDIVQAKLVCETLKSGSHKCHAFTTISHISKQFLSEPYDILVVNLEFPDDGMSIVQEIRQQISDTVPILCITGTHAEDKLIASLAAGANDYLVRPLRRRDLLTRIAVLVRQSYPTQTTGEQLTFGEYLFETARDRLTIAGKPVDVTKKEFDLALLFFRNLGRPLSRATIIESVWSGNSIELSRTVDTHVSRVRNKLKLTPERGYRLSPVYGFGYQLDELKASRPE